MSIVLPLVDETVVESTTELCEISQIHYWQSACSFKGRYRTKKGQLLCGRHYRSLYRGPIDNAANTLGLPDYVRYGAQRQWKMGTEETQKAYDEHIAKTQYFKPGQFAHMAPTLLPLVQSGMYQLTAEEKKLLPRLVRPRMSPLGTMITVLVNGAPEQMPALCFVCGHNGPLINTFQLETPEDGFKQMGMAHSPCAKWLNENLEQLDLKRKPCLHYVVASVDAAAQAAAEADVTANIYTKCSKCNESYYTVAGGVWNAMACQRCTARKHENLGVNNMYGPPLCPGCAIPHGFRSNGREKMIRACELWGIEAGRNVAKDLANFYTLEYLSIQHEWVNEYKREVVQEIANAYLQYSLAACGGEFRYITNDFAYDQKNPVAKEIYTLMKKPPYAGSRFDAWIGFKQLVDAHGADVLTVLVKDFPKTRRGSIGGDRWARCSKVAELYMRKQISEQEFVDMVFGLQHNGGSFLNKAFSLDYGPVSLKTLLDKKRAEPNPLNLLWIAAPQVLDLWEKAAEETDDKVLRRGVTMIKRGRPVAPLNARMREFR